MQVRWVDPYEETSPDLVLRAGLRLDLVDLSAAEVLAAARLPRVVRPGAGRDDHGRRNGWPVRFEGVAQPHGALACRRAVVRGRAGFAYCSLHCHRSSALFVRWIC